MSSIKVKGVNVQDIVAAKFFKSHVGPLQTWPEFQLHFKKLLTSDLLRKKFLANRKNEN